jgi:Ca-activated chloride channel homolog
MNSLRQLLEGFRFAQPWVLCALVLVPLLWLWLGKRRDAAAIGYSSLRLFQGLGKRHGGREGWFSHLLMSASLVFLIMALARPQSGQSFTKVRASGIDILLVLDVSSSMLAEDFSIGNQRTNRITAVKAVTKDFIEDRKNDRMGIIAFGGKPFLVSPMTLDHDWLLKNLQERVQISFEIDGTAIGSAISSAANRLKDRESKSRIIVLLTDGTNNAGPLQPTTAAEAAEALDIRIYTIGAGTRGIAPFPQFNRNGQQRRDMFGKPMYGRVQVEFDEETLKEIASMTGGKYFRATNTDSLEAIYDEINRLEKTEAEVDQYEQFDEWFMYLLAPGSILALLHLLLRYTLWRRLP